jgi:hypothetical protein
MRTPSSASTRPRSRVNLKPEAPRIDINPPPPAPIPPVARMPFPLLPTPNSAPGFTWTCAAPRTISPLPAASRAILPGCPPLSAPDLPVPPPPRPIWRRPRLFHHPKPCQAMVNEPLPHPGNPARRSSSTDEETLVIARQWENSARWRWRPPQTLK